MTAAKQKVALFWFRRDLRLHDNHALQKACESGLPVLPLFIFDPIILEKLENRDDPRVTFIHRTLAQLNAALRARGGDLLLLHAKPLQAYRALVEGDYPFEVKAVFTNRDYEPYARQRDKAVCEYLESHDIQLHSYQDQAIFEAHQILTKSRQKPYTVYTPYKKSWLNALDPRQLKPFKALDDFEGRLLWQAEQPFAVPTLEAMGFTETALDFPTIDIHRPTLARYDALRDFPAKDATSRLGIHLRFGTISVREIAATAQNLNPTFLSQIIWRDFFFQILFHFPQVAHQSFRPEYDRIEWRQSESDFQRWCAGTTGYPIVDAGMRELNQTGHMHNRVRMIVASFLCKHLLIYWQRGERYFAQKLLDYDLAANNGNWQWAAGSGCDAAPYFRVFNPWRQTEKFDPTGEYVSRWVPEHQSSNYPKPMIDHTAARNRALTVYKAGLEKNEPDVALTQAKKTNKLSHRFT